jgi:hypothetical protein
MLPPCRDRTGSGRAGLVGARGASGGVGVRSANISQVLGHDNIETTLWLHFYIHASANAEQRIGAMMNARWTSKPAPASNQA